VLRFACSVGSLLDVHCIRSLANGSCTSTTHSKLLQASNIAHMKHVHVSVPRLLPPISQYHNVNFDTAPTQLTQANARCVAHALQTKTSFARKHLPRGQTTSRLSSATYTPTTTYPTGTPTAPKPSPTNLQRSRLGYTLTESAATLTRHAEKPRSLLTCLAIHLDAA
jgi:hypothetical protein